MKRLIEIALGYKSGLPSAELQPCGYHTYDCKEPRRMAWLRRQRIKEYGYVSVVLSEMAEAMQQFTSKGKRLFFVSEPTISPLINDEKEPVKKTYAEWRFIPPVQRAMLR
jgi:hypothetical protein